ncbi:MAG TPA: TonB family protein [Chryseosolibacter sp.]|nr:TonB family protein [Chryseosolibacter sp.]
MNSIPEVSDNEIRDHMDFNQLIANHQLAIRKAFLIKYGLVTLVAIMAIGIYYAYESGSLNEKAATIKTKAAGDSIAINATVTSSATTTNRVNDIPEKKETPKKSKIKKDNEKVVEKKNAALLPDTTNNIQAADSALRKEPAAVPESAYVQAEPLAGYDHLFEYFRTNIKYPEQAVLDSIQGVVTVTFVVNAKGEVRDVRIDDKLGKFFVEENLSVIENMPAWKPAQLNGRNVSSKMSLPLTFRINKQ